MRLRTAAAVACFCSVPALAIAQDRPLRIGNVTAQLNASVPAFDAFTNYLSSRLDGRRFELVPLGSIEQMVRAVDAGEVDFVIASPVALVTLSTRQRVRPIATVTQSAGGRQYPWLASAVFVARGRTDLTRLEDARGKRVLALSPLALGGWLAALREWRRLGLDERTDFASVRFEFSYQKVATEVCNGTADVGVLPAGTLHELPTPCPGGLRVLPAPQGPDSRYPIDSSTPLYPEAAVAAVGALDEDIVRRVTIALLSVDDGSPVARAAAVSGFAAPLSYTSVQQLMQELRVGPYESFGRLTFTEALQQHAGKVLAVMTGFLSVLFLAFVRARRLNARLATSIEQQKKAEQERVQLESQLQQSRRLESIGRVAGGVAHDFNNLLTVINGYSQVLLMGPRDATAAREDLQQINKAGRRAAELTNQLLTFSKRQVSQLVSLDLNAMIREAEPLLRRLVSEDVELTFSLQPTLAATLGDGSQMHQVLMNLVVNARDAMPHGGRVEIATENVTVSASDGHPPDIPNGGEYVVLTVADTGTGMDSEIRQHIFEPFFSTKGESGTGLGLSTVYGIVRQRQGGIDVWSEPGQGTRFRIYLPRTDQQPEPVLAAPAVASTAPAWTRRILVVEDQDDVRAFALDVLRSSGYHVIEASSGEEAFALFNASPEPIHLLLTDVVMRGMNGRELAERFSLAHPAAGVLFTSGYPDDVTARKGVPRGTVAFLPKPYSPEALVSRVAELLSAAV